MKRIYKWNGVRWAEVVPDQGQAFEWRPASEIWQHIRESPEFPMLQALARDRVLELQNRLDQLQA